MWECGIVIVLGIINSTEVTQEMDYLYQTFNPQMYAITNRAASLNIARLVYDNFKESYILKDTGGGTQAISPMPTLPTIVPLFLLGKYRKHSGRRYDEQFSNKEKKLCIITIYRDELSLIVNGNKDDPI